MSDVVERALADLNGPRDVFLPDGSLRCQNCLRDPCRCGVPKYFAEAFDDAIAEIERLEEENAERAAKLLEWAGKMANYREALRAVK